jgi:hypothetical protein
MKARRLNDADEKERDAEKAVVVKGLGEEK